MLAQVVGFDLEAHLIREERVWGIGRGNLGLMDGGGCDGVDSTAPVTLTACGVRLGVVCVGIAGRSVQSRGLGVGGEEVLGRPSCVCG